MGEILLSELIEQTMDSIRSFEHSQSTVYQYQMAWGALTDYFIEHNQIMFSKQLAEQFVLESKTKLDTSTIKKWRYKLNRLTVLMLIECYEYDHVTWKHHKDDNPTRLLQSAYILLHTYYLNCLEKERKRCWYHPNLCNCFEDNF